MSSKSFFNSEMNNYNNLSVEIIEKWINQEIERIEKRPWNNGIYGSDTERKSIEILLENKTTIDTLKYVKKELRNLDLMLVNSPNWKKFYEVKK